MRYHLARVSCALIAVSLGAGAQASERVRNVPPFVARGVPGAQQNALEPLIGDWTVDYYMYIAGGTRSKPNIARGLKCHREWIAARHALEDVTHGSIGGMAYFREGLLNFDRVDNRYEWMTVDAINSGQMIYRGRAGAKPTLDMTGTFTDPGVLGENSVGKSIPMRTVITIESPNRNTFDLYMTPGSHEILAQHAVYTRVQKAGRSR